MNLTSIMYWAIVVVDAVHYAPHRPIDVKKLRTGLAAIEGIKVFGPMEGTPRTSTVSFLAHKIHANKIAKHLASKGIFLISTKIK